MEKTFGRNVSGYLLRNFVRKGLYVPCVTTVFKTALARRFLSDQLINKTLQVLPTRLGEWKADSEGRREALQ